MIGMVGFNPVRDLGRGLKAYLDGWRWLRQHRRYLALLVVPSVCGFACVVGGLSLLFSRGESLIGWILFVRPESWALLALYYVGKVLLYIAVVVLVLIGSQLVLNIVAAPVYDLVSHAIERELTGVEPPRLGLWGNASVILVELKKVALILSVSILLLCIPGLNVISSLSTAFFIGWDFYDYPLARRRWSFRQRARLAGREFWVILGLGLWLVIPFAQVVMIPLAVAGGTLLSLEALQRQQLLTILAPGRTVDAPI